MTRNIFVYGTLIDGFMKASAECDYLGRTKVRGTMYDYSWFPVVALKGDNKVVGHVFKINKDVLEEILDELDDYENVRSGLFKRVKVKTEFGKVWIYVFNGDTKSLKVIANGDWKDYLQTAKEVHG